VKVGRLAPSTVTSLVLSVMLLTWVGLIAIGASGVLAGAMGWSLGPGFVAGDFPGVTYTPDRCRDLMEYAPGAKSCNEAAASHHFEETVTYRLAAGVLGVLVLLGWIVVRRRWGSADLQNLPPGLVAGGGTALFGVAGLALLASGLELLLLGPETGAGADLSAAIVSLAVAAIFGVSLYRTLAVSSPG
jgi:hypothetical protein